MTRTLTNILASTLAMLLVASCSTTRRLDEDETLYTGLGGIKYDLPAGRVLPSGLKSEIYDAANAPTNKKMLFLLPVGLWAYNNANTDNWFGRWIYKTFAAEPVLLSDVRPEVRTKMIDNILDNYGYFGSSTSFTIDQQKNPRKAKVSYRINPGAQYGIHSVELLPDTCPINHFIDSIARRQPYLREGVAYNLDSLMSARVNIANVLRNRGYYFFKPEMLEYLADTIANPGSIDLRLSLTSNIMPFLTQRYVTGRVTFYANRNQGGGTPDTVQMRRATLIRMNPCRLRNKIVDECVTFRPGRYFSVRDINRTQSYLAQLGIFNAIDISAIPDTTAKVPTLDVAVACTFDMPIEVSIEANVSSKSNSYLGPGLTLGMTNHNLFGGGEQFAVKLTGTYEWQTGRGASSVFNSYEAGLNTSLSFPRFIAPKFIPRRRHASNWTRVSLNADLLNRPHYFKMAQFNTSYGYEWQASRYVNNELTLFRLTYTNLIKTTEVFDSITAANPAIALSFRSQFIPQLSYTFQYDRTFNRNLNVNITASAQEAGNLFWSIWQLCGKKGEKELFGTPFSQFVKGTAQIVLGRRMYGDHWLWGRVAVGAAHAYGNSSQVPYTEQFYCGGANSVRAFTVRSIGPGSYRAPSGDINGYFDQTGTFKFECNLEYRFPIYSIVHGAVFLDAGNVWMLRNDPQRPGGLLQGRTFLRDLATGTGVGLRFDISMLVLRADLGIGIHAPYDTGKRGYYNIRKFGDGLAFHLAIGYPF